MKKFAIGILSLFVLFGGLLLTACGEKVSLSVKDTSTIVLYTNKDENGADQKVVNVTLKNSSEGVGVSIISGVECISVPTRATKNGNESYSFVVNAVSFGDAQIRVYAIEDASKNQVLNVKVNTFLDKLVTTSSLNSNKYVVKEESAKLPDKDYVGTDLDAEKYFDLSQSPANIKDIDWTFADATGDDDPKQILNGEDVVAEIVSDGSLQRLYVYQGYTASKIKLKATVVGKPNVSNSIELDVLENVKFSNFNITGTYAYDKIDGGTKNKQEGYGQLSLMDGLGNVVSNQENISFELRRSTSGEDSDEFLTKINGELTIKTQHKIEVEPVFYKLEGGQYKALPRYSTDDEEGYETYFNVQTTYEEGDGFVKITFVIDANDTSSYRKFGDFLLAFEAKYRDYAYSVSTKNFVNVSLNTIYYPTQIEVSNGEQTLNNGRIEVYSNYVGVLGYKLQAKILPDDVVIGAKSSYFISVKAEQEDIRSFRPETDNYTEELGKVLKFYQNNEQIEFSFDGENYKSRDLLNGSEFFISAGDDFGNQLRNFKIEFVATSNEKARTTLNLDLYKIFTSTDTFNVSNINEGDVEDMPDRFVVSSQTAVEQDFNLRIYGISQINGLTLEHGDDSRFSFSNFRQISNGTVDDTVYVDVAFKLKLRQARFEGSTEFWFEHITNRTSAHFVIEAFVPMTSATVTNKDTNSSAVHIQTEDFQDYVLEGENLKTGGVKNETLTKIVLESGSDVTLRLDYQTLADPELGIGFYVMNVDALATYLSSEFGDAEVSRQYAQNIFNDPTAASLTKFISKYGNGFFGRVFQSLVNDENLSITKINDFEYRLSVFPDKTVRHFIAVKFDGFNENHEQVSFVRIFTVESLYSIQFVSPNVSSVALYSSETLSESEMGRASTNVVVSFRADGISPTFLGFENVRIFSDETLYEAVDGKKTNTTSENLVLTENTILMNDFYQLDSFLFSTNRLTFRVMANSTKDLSTVFDTFTVQYAYQYSYVSKYASDDNFEAETTTTYHEVLRRAEIQVQVLNEVRIEKVIWQNKTATGDIYLNSTQNAMPDEKNFTITTLTSPAGAGNGLRTISQLQNLTISEVSKGQTFGLKIGGGTTGGTGFLYIVPNDMVKLSGSERLLVYHYDLDEDGNIREINGRRAETAVYIPTTQIEAFYQFIQTCDEKGVEFGEFNGETIANFFFNNNNEKVYYRDIILRIRVTVADGSEEAPIRIYNEYGLRRMLAGNHYQVMNDITVLGWETMESLSGSISAYVDDKGNPYDVTITFASKKTAEGSTLTSGMFVGTLTGAIRNLTFAGEVSSSANSVGFVAGVNRGIIENVVVDVTYSSNNFDMSKLSSNVTSTNYTGGIVGTNEFNAEIINSFVYGLNISAGKESAGGIAGRNLGRIQGCGFEFYKFGEDKMNKITNTSNNVGGIVGSAGEASEIISSYVYSFTAKENPEIEVLVGNFKGAFIGKVEGQTRLPVVRESFAYLGNLVLGHNASDGTKVEYENSYITFNHEGRYKTRVFLTKRPIPVEEFRDVNSGVITEDDVKKDNQNWQDVTNQMDPTIWAIDTDKTINFGFVYLVNNTQSVPTDVNKLAINKVTSSNENLLKALPTDGGNQFVLFNYKTTVTPSGDAKTSELQTLNTIALTDLFNLSRKEVSSLILMTQSKDIALSTTSLQVLRTNVNEFELTVYSKMNYANHKTFKFVILNNLPLLYAEQNDVELREGQIILLQKGAKFTQTVTYSFDERIYLGGDEYSTEQRDDYAINYNNPSQTYYQANVNGKNLVLEGKVASGGTPLSIDTWLEIQSLSGETYKNYVSAIKNARKLSYKVSVYEGATEIVVVNTSALEIKASVHRTFDVIVKSDNTAEDIAINLWNNDLAVRVTLNNTIDGIKRFEVDDKLSLDFTWNRKVQEDGSYLFRVSIKITDEKRYLVDADYDNLLVTVAPQSQQSNSDFVRQISLKVKTQQLESKDMTLYAVNDRQIVDSVLYLNPSNMNTSVLSPSSEAILVVTASPAYALMTHFDLTYTAATTGNGKTGIVSFNRLLKNDYGYYTNSSNTTQLANGLRIKLTDEDKKGNGIFFFRVYVSSSFTTGSRIQLALNFFNGDTVIDEPCTSNVTISYLKSAEISINGQSTYLLPKGESATITVDVDEGQTISSFYLQNTGTGISKTDLVMSEVLSDGTIRYTSTLYASVLATVVKNGQLADNGIFYVYVSVERMLNGKREVKEDYVSVCLVDFAIDGNNISLEGSSQNYTTMNINGKEEKVWEFSSYVDGSRRLAFNYPVTPNPENINYNPDRADEVEKARLIREHISQFRNDFAYQDPNANYYINYEYNSSYATYDKLDLWEGLYYIASNGNATAVYNRYQDTVLSNDFFNITKHEVTGSAPYFTIDGLKAGSQLMKMQTVVYYQGVRLTYDCYFRVNVTFWTDEDTPKPIYNAEDFIGYLRDSQEPGDYILMDDIVLNDYTPLNTNNVSSLDGNGYVIHINSFAKQEESTLNYALFDIVSEISTLKNLKVNIYNGGQISVNIAGQRNLTVNAAGFAIENNGTIYNCEVVAYYEQGTQLHAESGDVGLVVRYTNGENGDAIQMQNGVVTSNIAGFVVTNNNSILNSRVGGEEIKHIYKVNGNANNPRIRTKSLGNFVITGQGQVAGFVCSNNGNISACFANKVQINNQILSNIAVTAGFTIQNSGNIQGSYVAGASTMGETRKQIRNEDTNISSMGYVSGFVYTNDGIIKNSYSNIAIDFQNNGASFVSGFVYINETGGEITLCYTACKIDSTDTKQMPFSGRDDNEANLNNGLIDMCYYYEPSATDTKKQMELGGIKPVGDNIGRGGTEVENIFYGFSFSSGTDLAGNSNYDGIWLAGDGGLELVSANKIAFSNRYAVTNEISGTSFFYNTNIIDEDTMTRVDLSYGTEINPIIIRNAEEFAKATGDATNPPISSYREFYTDTSVFGHYRLVNNIDMSQVNQDGTQVDAENRLPLLTFKKTFSGLLDGNGFTMSNINLGSSVDLENYGLFAKLYDACVMNLDFTVSSIRNTHANSVGTLAGTAVNSRIISITISPTETDEGSLSMTSINGLNTIGGVVGILMGSSQMIDVTAQNIEVRSSSSSSKTIYSNEEYVGKTLRNLAQNQRSLLPYISQISYAGAIAGYVDVTKQVTSDEYVKYSGSLKSSDCDIIKVHVSNSVNIYGEIVGGLFGYVGDATYIYDAQLEIDASSSRTTPSYIVSKNLFAGGLIGENYGGLFAVGAKYSEELSTQIEQQEYPYYQNGSATERGQDSIFSFSESDTGLTNRSDDALFIGGLVGYMGGGFINVGYSKLNVIAHSNKTIAVGGIVGAVGYSNTQYELAATLDNSIVNVFFQEVYASGDLYADGDGEYDDANKGISGGLIGAIGVRQDSQIKADAAPIIAIKKAMAMNYYSYSGQRLLGDGTDLKSDKHFAIAGKTYRFDSKMVEQGGVSKDEYLTVMDMPGSAKFYIVDNNSQTDDVVAGTGSATGTRKSVGGYGNISAGGSVIALNPYGFKQSTSTTGWDQLIQAVHIGTLPDEETQYSIFNSYFLENGWANDIWKHDMNTPFPYIDLFEASSELYWDATVVSTREVLEKVKSGEAKTVVVRGKEDNLDNYIDIDLRSDGPILGNLGEDAKELLGDNGIFDRLSGVTLISYKDYMETADSPIGVLSSSSTDGGETGAKVGFILDSPMFEQISGSYINGINFYLVPRASVASGVIDYTLINTGTYDSTIIANSRIVYNRSVDRAGENSVGLITGQVSNSSFISNTIELRNNATITLTAAATDGDPSVYMGLIAGKIEKAGGFNSINVERLTLETKANNVDVSFNIIDEYTENAYVGLYAGSIGKTTMSGSANDGGVSVGISNFSKSIKLNINHITRSGSASTKTLKNMYLGGFAGETLGVENIGFYAMENVENTRMDIYQRFSTETLYAGLGFGAVASNATIANSSALPFTLRGALYQVVEGTFSTVVGSDKLAFEKTGEQNYKTGVAKVGGVIGSNSDGLTIRNVSTDFSLSKINIQKADASRNIEYREQVYADGDAFFNTNAVDYAEETNPYVVSIGSAVGGFVGEVTGGSVFATSTCNIAGNIDVIVDNSKSGGDVSVGGFFGTFNGGLTAGLSSSNLMNISIRQVTNTENGITANLGGVIGLLKENGTGVPEAEFGILINQSDDRRIGVAGNVLSSVNVLRYGGAIGYVERKNVSITNNAVCVSQIAYGGAVRIYGETIEGGEVAVGGVIGEFNSSGTESSTNVVSALTNNLSYGDVFVNYPTSVKEPDSAAAGGLKTTYLNYTLKSYNFGGIVGGLPTNPVFIGGNVSIMTSFNDKLNKDGSNYGNAYSVGAIAGKSSGSARYGGTFNGATYRNNIYSSGVALAMQEEDGNVDYAYGTNLAYLGYLTEGQLKSNETKASTTNILPEFNGVVQGAIPYGHKLQPRLITANSQFEVTTENREDENVEVYRVGGSEIQAFHGIHWMAIGSNEIEYNLQTSSDVTGKGLAEKFKNSVLVGNGQTIKVSDERKVDVNDKVEIPPYSGLINAMGEDGEELTFNVISALVVKLDTEMDLNSTKSPTYGGVVGQTYGHSIIYGLGVEGELSVGGEGATIKLGGIVGEMKGGMIAQSYFDANMIYRAAGSEDAAYISGITNLNDYNNTILATYSSGSILSYLPNNIYTFANYEEILTADVNKIVIKDCYTNTNALVNDIVSGGTATIYGLKKDGIITALNSVNASYSYSAGANVDGLTSNKTIGNMAVNYSYAGAGTGKRSLQQNAETGAINKWYFSPYTNNGYATHGFGFLKNVSAFTRVEDAERITIPETTEEGGTASADQLQVIKLYTYTEVPFDEILSNLENKDGSIINAYAAKDGNWWFFGVSNEGKLEQVLKENSYNENDLRYCLTNDLIIQNDSQFKAAMGGNAGVWNDTNNFIFDGDNHTLDFNGITGAKALFGTVNGTIQNLRLVNVDMNSTGTLASELVGNMNNIAVVGNLTVNGNIAGGVVGTLKGSVEAVEGAVNVTNKLGGRIVGGLVGLLEVTTEANVDKQIKNVYGNDVKYTGIYYSSNSGQVISSMTGNTTVTNPESDPSAPLSAQIVTDYENGTSNETQNINLVAGGVVGYAGSGTNIENSYNANSVITGYTQVTGGNYVGGGIVGYSNKAAIKSSYNAGMVISGNYGTATAKTYYSDSNDGLTLDGAKWENDSYTFTDVSSDKHYAYAGGIFGYGEAGSVSDCINDASIEALGEAPTQFIGKKIVGNLKDGYDKVPKVGRGYASIKDGKITFRNRYDKSKTLVNLYMELKGEDFKWAAANDAKLTDVFDDLKKINFVNGEGTQIYFEEAYPYSTMNFYVTYCSEVDYNNYYYQRLTDDEINRQYGKDTIIKVIRDLNDLTPNFPDYPDESGMNLVGEYGTLNNLSFKLYNYYNPGRAREVYAYGIGFMNNGEFANNNYSSEDNIKNDGSIGEVSDVGNKNRKNSSVRDNTITFYRETFLGNQGLDGDLKFVGQFNSGGQIGTSGYDSYGLVSRVYATDTIKRRFADQAVNFHGWKYTGGVDPSSMSGKFTNYGYKLEDLDYEKYFESGYSSTGRTDIITFRDFLFYTDEKTEGYSNAPLKIADSAKGIGNLEGRTYGVLYEQYPYHWAQSLVALELPKWMQMLSDAYKGTQYLPRYRDLLAFVHSDDQIYYDKLTVSKKGNGVEFEGKAFNDGIWRKLESSKVETTNDFNETFGFKYGGQYFDGFSESPLNVFTRGGYYISGEDMVLRSEAMNLNQTTPTTYAESAEFENYDNILKDKIFTNKTGTTYYDTIDQVRGYTTELTDKRKIGLVGFNLGTLKGEAFSSAQENVAKLDDASTNVQNNINQIDLAREEKENFKSFTVNGKYVSIASTSKDLTNSYLPYAYTGEVTIGASELKLFSGTLKRSNIEIVSPNIGAFQITDLTEQENGDYKIGFVVRAANKLNDPTVQVNIKYTTDPISFTISKGNVVYDTANKTTQVALVNQEQTLADILGVVETSLEKLIGEIKNNTDKYDYNITVGDYKLGSDFTLEYGNVSGFGNCAYLKFNKIVEDLPTSLKISVTDKQFKGAQVPIVIKTVAPTISSVEIEKTKEQSLQSYQEYFENENWLSEVSYETGTNRIDLSKLLEFKNEAGEIQYKFSKMAFGDEEYEIHYNGTWAINKQPAAKNLSIEGNFLVVKDEFASEFLNKIRKFSSVYNFSRTQPIVVDKYISNGSDLDLEYVLSGDEHIIVQEDGRVLFDWEYIRDHGKIASTETLYGMKFYTYSSVDIPINLSKITVNNPEAGSIEVKNAGGATIYMRQGMFSAGSAFEVPSLNQQPSSVKFTKHDVSYEIDEDVPYEVDDRGEFRNDGYLVEMEKHLVANDEEIATYKWDKSEWNRENSGLNVNESDTKALIDTLFGSEEISQVSTTKYESSGTWTYTLYSNGLIGISYVSIKEEEKTGKITIGQGGETQEIELDDTHKAFIRKFDGGYTYIYNPIDNKVYKFDLNTDSMNLSENSVEWRLSNRTEEGQSIIETYIKDLKNDNYNFIKSKMQNATLEDFIKASQNNFSTIVADIVGDNIYFVKTCYENDDDNYYSTESYKYISSEYSGEIDAIIPVDFSEALNEACTDAGVTRAEFKDFELRRADGSWTQIVENNLDDFDRSIPESEWEQGFSLRYKRTVDKQNIGVTLQNSAASGRDYDIDFIVLSGDVHLNGSVDKNNKTFVGNEHILKFVPQNGSLFNTQDGVGDIYLRNVTFISIAEPNELATNENYNPFIKGDLNMNLSNVKVYGTTRNVKGAANSKVYSFVDSGEKELKDVKNYSTVFGAECDGLQKNSVSKTQNVTIVDNIENSNSILIAGDGKKGMKGADGTYNAGSLPDRNGKDCEGNDFGTGGTIEVKDVDKSNRLIRNGRNGIPGFGGNGVNGCPKVINGNHYILAGGNAGSTKAVLVENASAGGLLAQRKANTKQMSGCGGIGAFGRIVKTIGGDNTVSYKFYRAASFGKDSFAEEWISKGGENTIEEHYFFGSASGINIQFYNYGDRKDENGNYVFVALDCKDSYEDKRTYTTRWRDKIWENLRQGNWTKMLREGDEFYIFVHSDKNVGLGARCAAKYIAQPDYHSVMIWPANGNFLSASTFAKPVANNA